MITYRRVDFCYCNISHQHHGEVMYTHRLTVYALNWRIHNFRHIRLSRECNTFSLESSETINLSQALLCIPFQFDRKRNQSAVIGVQAHRQSQPYWLLLSLTQSHSRDFAATSKENGSSSLTLAIPFTYSVNNCTWKGQRALCLMVSLH